MEFDSKTPEIKSKNNPMSQERRAVINSLRAMGRVLATQLADQPTLTESLSILVHTPELSYEAIVRQTFDPTTHNLHDIANNPFLEAYINTPEVNEERRGILAATKASILDGQTPKLDRLATFLERVEVEIPFMAEGFKFCVLYENIIPPLTEEEIKEKRRLAVAAWRDANPDDAAQIQKFATQRAAELAQPRKYSIEVKQQIQEWFNKGYEYPLVVDLLHGIGIDTSVTNLRSLVSTSRGRLKYTPVELERNRRQGIKRAIKRIYALTSSTTETIEILKDLGVPRETSEIYIKQFGLRERADWRKPLNIEGRDITMEDLLLETSQRGFSSITEEYQAFLAPLQAIGEKILPTRVAYNVRRSTLLRAINS